jgi:hypothetical protein
VEKIKACKQKLNELKKYENIIKKTPIITAKMLPNSENLKKNPIVPLEVNITPISRKTLSSFSLSITNIKTTTLKLYLSR